MYSYQGIGELAIAVYDNGMNIGSVARIGKNDTGYWCKSGEVFHGVCLWHKDNTATLQVKGFVTVPYSGTTAPTVGYCEMVADGNGCVKVASDVAGNVKRLVVAVDTTAQKVTFLL